MVIKLLEKHQQAKSFSFQKIWRCKLIIGLIVILMAIVGTVYFILYYTHRKLSYIYWRFKVISIEPRGNARNLLDGNTILNLNLLFEF